MPVLKVKPSPACRAMTFEMIASALPSIATFGGSFRGRCAVATTGAETTITAKTAENAKHPLREVLFRCCLQIDLFFFAFFVVFAVISP